MFEEARVGDVIWSEKFGPVTITTTRGVGLYPINILTPSGQRDTCTICGRGFIKDLKPSYFWSEPQYEIPPKPKRKVKKTLEVWVNIYPNRHACFHDTAEDADRHACANRSNCLHIVKDYEVEE